MKIKQKSSKKILSLKEAKHLILCLERNRHCIWEYRDYAMIYLMITTGIRSVEVRRAKIKDISLFGTEAILYIQGKGRKTADDFVKLTPDVYKAIQQYLKKRKDKYPYLFISHHKRKTSSMLSRSFFVVMMKRVLKQCDLEYTCITAHSLRHTAATLNLQRGSSLEETSRFMRHQKIATTFVYAHNLNRIKDDSENQIEHFILKEDPFLSDDESILLDIGGKD